MKMKKIYLSLLSLTCAMGINAQTLTQANHAPAAGDMFSVYQCDSTNITPGASGAGAVWNYSTIVTHSNIVSNYTASAVTNTAYPNADIAVASGTNDISYFKSTTSNLKYFGGNINLGAVAATLNYTSPAVYAGYPMTLNSNTTSTTGGALYISGNTGSFTGNSNVVADGTGTLILPGATYTNVLRVVTTQTLNYTVSIITGVVTQLNYNYYAAGIKNPVFTISTSTLTGAGASTQTFVTRSKPSSVGIEKNTMNTIEMSVFPNPSNSFVNFATESKNAASVTIYDLNGKAIETKNLINGSVKLDVSNYSVGIYSYKVISNTNHVLKTGKLSVAH
ncbi:MAG: hypothetical protein JWO32_2483 [Bacteroidetes bacterium]|nr:hypothetical protein [Bacteroidota bacterium]